MLLVEVRGWLRDVGSRLPLRGVLRVGLGPLGLVASDSAY